MFARVSLAAATAVAAAVALAAPAAASSTHHLSFYEKQTSFSQRGSTIDFTSTDYSGTSAKHAAKPTASDHFTCTFTNQTKPPSCIGQLAVGGSMLLIHGNGGMGDFTIPIVGGTGGFLHAHGKVRVQDLDQAGDRSELTVTYSR